MLNEVIKDLKEGNNIIMESDRAAIALSHGAAFVFSAQDLYTVTSPNSGDSEIFNLFTSSISKSSTREILSMIRPMSKAYPYDKIETELKAAIIKRGASKIFNQLRINDIDEAISIGAHLENFTGKGIETPNINVKMISAFVGNRERRYYDPSDELLASLKKQSPIFKLREFTVREALDMEKDLVKNPTNGFETMLLFWFELEPPYKVPQLLYEKVDEHNRPELWSSLPFFGSGSLELESRSLEAERRFTTIYDHIAVFDVLARLQRVVKNDTFWVMKGKATKEVESEAKRQGFYLIEEDLIKDFTGTTDPDKIKRIKHAILVSPNTYWIVRARNNSNGSLQTVKIPVSHALEILENQQKGVKGFDRVVEFRLNDRLFKVEGANTTNTEARNYSRLLSLPPQCVLPAARLFGNLMSYNHWADGARSAFLSVETAISALGVKSLLSGDQKQKGRAVRWVETYLDYLKEVGNIEAWKRQENGAYFIQIGI